jgi:hypothetical protein
MNTVRDVIVDMQATMRAHEQWAMSCECTTSEAATSAVFAGQIRDWLAALGRAQAVDAVDPVGDAPAAQAVHARKRALHD